MTAVLAVPAAPVVAAEPVVMPRLLGLTACREVPAAVVAAAGSVVQKVKVLAVFGAREVPAARAAPEVPAVVVRLE